MSMMASTPRIIATPSSGSPNVANVPERITSDARGTAATPLLVIMSVTIMRSCVVNVIGTPAACATNTDAMAR
jgi:hypothetical protein